MRYYHGKTVGEIVLRRFTFFHVKLICAIRRIQNVIGMGSAHNNGCVCSTACTANGEDGHIRWDKTSICRHGSNFYADFHALTKKA